LLANRGPAREAFDKWKASRDAAEAAADAYADSHDVVFDEIGHPWDVFPSKEARERWEVALEDRLGTESGEVHRLGRIEDGALTALMSTPATTRPGIAGKIEAAIYYGVVDESDLEDLPWSLFAQLAAELRGEGGAA
jgi:hypothetical protein